MSQTGFRFETGRMPVLRCSSMITLLIATRNAHKVEEIRAILGGEFGYLTLNNFPSAPEVIEDGGTFAGNATKKAAELAKWLSQVRSAEGRVRSGEFNVHGPRSAVHGPPATGRAARELFVMADDSGLEVDALKGAPGVHSARFAALDSGQAGNSPTLENNAKLLQLLGGVPAESRTARFRCVLALTPVFEAGDKSHSPVCYADEFEMRTELFEGVCEGRIGFAPRGAGGFGYDPLFVPEGYQETFAELGEEVKNRLSHRARALAKLKKRLEQV